MTTLPMVNMTKIRISVNGS